MKKKKKKERRRCRRRKNAEEERRKKESIQSSGVCGKVVGLCMGKCEIIIKM